MLLLERNGKTVNDGSQNLQEFPNTVVAFRLIDKSIENIGNCSSNERPMAHEFSVNAVQNSFQVIPFPRIFRIKEFHQLKAEGLINVLFGSLSIDFTGNNESQEELVGDLQVGPGGFQDRFVFLWIEVISCRRQSPTDVGPDHSHEVPLDLLSKDLLSSRCVDVIHKFQKSLALHILASFVRGWIVKGEDDAAGVSVSAVCAAGNVVCFVSDGGEG